MTKMLINFLFLVLHFAAATAQASPRIVLEKTSTLAGEPVGMRIVGLESNELITLHAKMLQFGNIFSSQSTFQAGLDGTLDIATQAPLLGSYTNADIWGPYWSMTFDHPGNPEKLEDRAVEFSIEKSGLVLDTKRLQVAMQMPNVKAQDVTVDGLYGTFFSRANTSHAAVIVVLGGSEGGLYMAPYAAYLASLGYPSLALAYFNVPGTALPADLKQVRLEYFQKALQWLAKQPEVDAKRIGIIGFSRGAELALTLASHLSEFKAVVAMAPSSVNWGNFIPPEVSSWQSSETDLPFVPFKLAADAFQPSPIGTVVSYRSSYLESYQAWKASAAGESSSIPVEKINGPILLLSGEDDRVWPSCVFAADITKRLEAKSHGFSDASYCFKGASHVPLLPGTPTTSLMVPMPNQDGKLWMDLGGNAEDTAKAGETAWIEVRRFFKNHL